MAGNFLQHMLRIEATGTDVYRAVNLRVFPGNRSVYGGQLVAQSLKAAVSSTSPEYKAHSLHCYYMNRVIVQDDIPLEYHVDRLRDGATFSTRAVRAIQKGATVFHMTASFQKPESSPVSHQCSMPDVPKPSQLKTLDQMVEEYIQKEDEDVKKFVRRRVKKFNMMGVEMRAVDPDTYFNHRIAKTAGREPTKPIIQTWMKMRDNKSYVDVNTRDVLAYWSDFGMITPAWMAHPGLDVEFATSLDHSLWFHEDYKPDEWLLYDIESPKFVNGRSLTMGHFWTEDGRMVASVSQEGLTRGSLLDNKL